MYTKFCGKHLKLFAVQIDGFYLMSNKNYTLNGLLNENDISLVRDVIDPMTTNVIEMRHLDGNSKIRKINVVEINA